MDQATQEGTAVGTAGNKKNIIDESLLRNRPVLSDTKTEDSPMTACQRDAQEMLQRRSEARQKGDNIHDDRRIKGLLEGGDQCVNDPTAPLTISVHASEGREEIVECAEAAKTADCQILYLFRNLQLDIFHQEKIVKKRCIHKIKRCTEPFWMKHRDDDPACSSYHFVDGETRDIDLDQDCTTVCGWTFYNFDRVTIQNECTEMRGESWVGDDPGGIFEKVRSNACNVVKTECVSGPETRYYYGKGFQRDCWSQRMTIVWAPST
jgi:hypothetical protein